MDHKIAITGTFIDEITDDIPSQNWAEKEWDADFRAMKETGIRRVFLIRAGLDRILAYPSRVIPAKRKTMPVYTDLVEMFFRLAEKYELELWPGNYVGRNPNGGYFNDAEFDIQVANELWERYGSKSKAFGGWYFSKEIGGFDQQVTEIFAKLARHCKKISGDLPIMISPWLGHSPEAPRNAGGKIAEWREIPYDFDHFQREWDEILSRLSGAVDIVAWQDGGASYQHLPQLLALQKELGKKYGITIWMNTESFDRDMPFRFPPINWNRLRYKLECAAEAGIEEAITFEFSHFMSPNSMWPSAQKLHERYMEYLQNQGV